MSACDACLRRAALLAALAGRIEIARHERRPLRDILGLSDDALLLGVAGEKAGELRQAVPGPDQVRAGYADAGLITVCCHDARYPERLLDDPSAPKLLGVKVAGAEPIARLEELVGGDAPAVAVVGTRQCSAEGAELARALGRGLAAAGITVVSGMALGIDSAAHVGALEGGGRTIAVLAGGADVAYPVRKARLHERIAQSGAVVSEMPAGFRAMRWSFVARNRIIAGLAQATVVVEAAEKSGLLITAEMALELGRDVGAVPGFPLSWRSAGTNLLLRDGATLVREVRDILDLVLGPDAVPAARGTGELFVAAPPELEPRLATLLAAVESGQDTIHALARTPAEAQVAAVGLTELELAGLIRRGAGGRYRRELA